MNPGRCLIDGLGLGPAYHDLWWRIAARRRVVITDWSRRHQALFIHVPKAAGLSVYQALGMDRPPDTHAPAAACRVADAAVFDTAYKFAVVRNPWDRLVSAYHYLSQSSAFPQDRQWAQKRLAAAPDFGQFLAALQSPWRRNQIMGWRHFLTQKSFLEVDGGIAVDRLIPFQALNDGLADVAREIGVALQPAHVNKSKRGDYRRYYTDEGAELVAKIYQDDIALTGAAFDDPASSDRWFCLRRSTAA